MSNQGLIFLACVASAGCSVIFDSEIPRGDVENDAGRPTDGGNVTNPCPTREGASKVFSFDEDQSVDGTETVCLAGACSDLVYEPSDKSGCGSALRIREDMPFIVSRDAALASESIEVKVRLKTPSKIEPGRHGIFAKDEFGTKDGHFALYLTHDGKDETLMRLSVRFQNEVIRIDDQGEQIMVETSFHRCSKVVTANTWQDVSIRLGPREFEISVNGEGSDYSGSISFYGDEVACNKVGEFATLSSNDRPWVFGSDNEFAGDGEGQEFKRGGMLAVGTLIDEVALFETSAGRSRRLTNSLDQ